MFPPINVDTLEAFFIGIMVGMLLVAIALCLYGTITSHIAYKKNEKQLADGLEAIRQEYRK